MWIAGLLVAGCGGGEGGVSGGGGSGSNAPPVAVNDTATTVQGQALSINVLANDSDPEGRPLSVTLNPSAYQAQLLLEPNGAIRFSPDNTYLGAYKFTYTITDAGGLTAVGEVTVTVAAKFPLVFVADDDTSGLSELYFSDGLSTRKLNAALQAGEQVQEFRLARSAGVVVYRQGNATLVLASLRAGVAPRVVSQGLAAGEFVPLYAVSADGRFVAYVVDGGSDRRLYLVDASGSSIVTTQVPIGNLPQTAVPVLEFHGTDLILLRSRSPAAGVVEFEILRAPVSNPASLVPISATVTSAAPVFRSIGAFRLTADGTKVVYQRNTGFSGELVLAETAVPNSDRVLTPSVPPGVNASLVDFKISARNDRAYYRLAMTGAYYRVYAVDFATPGISRLLDPDTIPTTSTSIGQIESFEISDSNERLALKAIASGSRAVFTVDGDTGQVQYGTVTSTPEMGYAISPDGSLTVTAAEVARAIPWGDPASTFQFSPILNTGYYSGGQYSPDGAAVAFIRNQTTRELRAFNPRPSNGTAKWGAWDASRIPANTRGVGQFGFAAAQPY